MYVGLMSKQSGGLQMVGTDRYTTQIIYNV